MTKMQITRAGSPAGGIKRRSMLWSFVASCFSRVDSSVSINEAGH